MVGDTFIQAFSCTLSTHVHYIQIDYRNFLFWNDSIYTSLCSHKGFGWTSKIGFRLFNYAGHDKYIIKIKKRIRRSRKETFKRKNNTKQVEKRRFENPDDKSLFFLRLFVLFILFLLPKIDFICFFVWIELDEVPSAMPLCFYCCCCCSRRFTIDVHMRVRTCKLPLTYHIY